MELGDYDNYINQKMYSEVPPRDKAIQEVIDKIIIDLPSRKEALSLNENSLSSSNDLARLNGLPYGSFQPFYLRNNTSTLKDRLYAPYFDANFGVGDSKHCERTDREKGIRPVLRFNQCPELWDEILSSAYKDTKTDSLVVDFGYLPTHVAYFDASILPKAFKENSHELVKTNETYTFDSVYVHFDKSSPQKPFKPKEYPVYEFYHRKYIRFKVYQNDNGHAQYNVFADVIDKVLDIKLSTTHLSDGKNYDNGAVVWLEVTKIPWIVDTEEKILIAKNNLVAGIRYEDCWWYLNYYLKYELLRNDELILSKVKHKVNKTGLSKPIDNSKSEQTKTDEITEIIQKINKYRKYYYGDVDIETRVSELLTNYNKELDNLSSNIGNEANELSLNIKNPKALYEKLVRDFNDLLFEIKNKSEKAKNYHDMMDILNECQKEKIDISKDELCTIINTIKTVLIGFITDEKKKNTLNRELDQIITNNINRNRSYIEEFKTSDNARIRTLDELKLEFRSDLHPFLIRLNLIVEKQDLVNEILNNVNIMITNHFTESKNKIVKNYLSILNEIISNIKEYGTEEEKETLRKLVQLDFTIDDDINVIVRKLESMITKAYKIELDIRERYDRNREIDNLRVHIDTSNIFKDNNQSK